MNLKDILIQIREPIPIHHIKQKIKGGNSIDFVPWYNLCDLLDERAGIGNWSWEIKEICQIGNALHLVGILTIYGDDRNLSMMSTGTEDVDVNGYGDASSNSEAMALRRCCAKFGMGRDMWRKDGKKNTSAPPEPQNTQRKYSAPQRGGLQGAEKVQPAAPTAATAPQKAGNNRQQSTEKIFGW